MIKTELRIHQNEAVERALPHEGFALLLEQRTGKTLAALAIAAKRETSFLFIVCPKNAIGEWERQIPRHWKNPPEIEIINFESLIRIRRQLYAQAKKWPPGTGMIVDEGQRIKKRGSKQSRTCRHIGRYADWRLLLTGTPISPKSNLKRRKRKGNLLTVTRGLEDMWAQFDFINPEIFGSFDRFADQYLIFGGFKGKKVVDYKNVDEFNEILHKYSYRKTLNEVRRMAGKSSVKIHRCKIRFKLMKRTRGIYDQLDQQLVAKVGRKEVEVAVVVGLSQKLQQVTGGAVIATDGSILEIGTEKLDALQTLLTARIPDRKVVIVCRFVHEIHNIRVMLNRVWSRKKVKIIAGGSPHDGNFDCDFIILQTQSGVAIDLSAAKAVVFYSWDHSYINYEQTRFRVLSYDTDQVSYYYLIADGTIDEQFYESSARKKELAELVCDVYRRRIERDTDGR